MFSYACAAVESALLDPEPSAIAEPNSPYANGNNVRTCLLPSLLYAWAHPSSGTELPLGVANIG
jgi:hypothetical protein